MPKSRKRRPHPRDGVSQRELEEQQFTAALLSAAESPTPVPLLHVASLVISICRGAESPSTAPELVRGMASNGRPETSAAALAVATLLGDDQLRRHVRRELADRGQVPHRWLAELHRSQALDRAVEISTVYRDTDRLLVGVTVPDGHPLTALVLVDNEFGGWALDCIVVEKPLADVIPMALHDAGRDARQRDIAPADARVRIEDAIREPGLPPRTNGYDNWEQSRPLLRWMVSLLPAGGPVDVRLELSDEDLDQIAERFLASPFGPAWAGGAFRSMVDEVVMAGSGNGIGDPLIWSPGNVRTLLHPELGLLDLSAPYLDRTPELLRDLVRFGHAERGVHSDLTATALAAIEACAGPFLAAVRALDDD